MRVKRLIPVLLFLTVAAFPFASSGADHSSNSLALQDLKKFQLAPGLKAELFASEPSLQNPVAFSIDGRGRFFVAETHRWNNSIFDITQNTPWLLDDLSLRTVNDRATFLARVFATNLSVLTTNSELIRLVEDRDGDGHAETSSVFADGFNETTSGTAAGVLVQGTNVWVTSIPDLWRLSNQYLVSSNQPARSSMVTRGTEPWKLNTDPLITGLGVHISVSGHDVHGLIRGHDGRIYFSFGDRGMCVTNREGAVLNVPDTGGVLRCEPDGRNLEIFCIGLRNPQELAFDDYGNLWTVDNDTAGADPCRVLHLVEGGDYGWRMSYQHMKGFGPWVQEELWRGGLDGILPPAGTVSQGPAGLTFYPGIGATPQLAGKFVHADFPGGIWAFSVQPRGASFEIAGKEKIVWNCWPTDVDFGPDGGLYVLDWVQGWGPPGRGRIYRLTTTNAVNARELAEVQSLLRDGMTKRGEKELLALLGHKDRRVRLEAQWELASRGEAGIPLLLRIAREGGSAFARLHALWGLAMIWRNDPPPAGRRAGESTFDQMNDLLPLLQDKHASIRVRAADLLADLRFLNADASAKKMFGSASLADRIAALRAEGGILSGFGGQSDVREKISRFEKWRGTFEQITGQQSRGSSIVHPMKEIEILSGDPLSNDTFLIHELARFYGVEVGRYLRWNVSDGVIYTNHFLNLGTNLPARLAGLLTYRRLAYDGITNFLTDSNPRLVLEAVRAINEVPIQGAMPALAALLAEPRFHDPNWGWSALSNITPAGPFSANVRPPSEQVWRRALNAHFRLGEAANAEALARFAIGALNPNSAPAGLETGAPSPLRSEALFLLGSWEVLPATVGDLPIKPTKDPNHGSVPTVNPENWPGWFDRVVGLWRPLPPRPPDDARRALAPHIATLIGSPSVEVARAALDAAVKLHLTNASPALFARLQDRSAPVPLRLKVPSALAALEANELTATVKLALEDSNAEVRTAALPYLGRLGGDSAVQVLGGIVAAEIAGDRRSEDNLHLAQAALTALGNLPSPAADDLLRLALTNLLAGTLPAALELDLIEAASRRNDSSIKSLIVRHETTLSKSDELAPWRIVLHGGDAGRGRTIFLEKAEVQCLRCHQVKGEGGTVGPALDGIGKRQSREYLLESILQPNKAITTGFENVLITLKNGASHAGQVKSESDVELELNIPEDGIVTLKKPDIQSRTRGLSAMPDGLGPFLSKRELRDLIEFLASLK